MGLKACTLKKARLKGRKKRSPCWRAIRDDVIAEVESVWESRSIPVIKTSSIAKRMDSLFSKYDSLLKQLNRKDRKDKLFLTNMTGLLLILMFSFDMSVPR